MKSVSKILRCLRVLRASFWKRERFGQSFGDCRVAAGGGGRVVVVGLWQRLARTFARRCQLFQGRFQFSFSDRYLFDSERNFDTAVVAVQEMKRLVSREDREGGEGGRSFETSFTSRPLRDPNPFQSCFRY